MPPDDRVEPGNPYRGNATPGGDTFPRLAWGGFVAVLACLVLRGGGGGGVVSADEADFVRTLIEVKDRVEDDYVADVEPDTLRRAAIDGMLALATDANTGYVPPEEQEAFTDRLDGNFRGIGVTLTLAPPPGGGLGVERPLPGGPALAAGVRTGDVIVRADGVDLRPLAQAEAIELVKGPVGTSVELTIERPGQAEPVVLTVERDVVSLPILDGFGRDPADESPQFLVTFDVPGVGSGEQPRVAYVRLREFTAGAATGVREALRQVADDGGLDGAILDLRGNPGGLLDEAVALADLFLPAGKLITWEKGKTIVRPPFVSTAANDELGQALETVPLAILVDGGSASASEVVSGALADHNRASIVGSPTYGKGSVQSVYGLGSRDRLGQLRLTRAYYHLPGGRVLTRTADGRASGVEVDVSVPLVEGDVPRDAPDGPDFPRQVFRAYEILAAALAARDAEPAAPVAPATRPAG